jgi:hypothetical protein
VGTWGADKSLAQPGKKQARKDVRGGRDFNDIESRAVIKFYFFSARQAPKETDAILTETLACFLPGRAKDLSATLVHSSEQRIRRISVRRISYCMGLTLWPWSWTFTVQHTIYVKREYFMNQEG